MALNLFDNVIVILLAAVTVVVICKRLDIPAIIGYLLIGILVGPQALGLIDDPANAQLIAEFGVVFLMFTIGLEFSISKMIRMKNMVFGLGGAQVFLTALATTLVGLMIGMTLTEAMVIACIASMSSTAIVSKQLSDQNELSSLPGRKAISILLFQDLAVIPFFIFFSSLSGGLHALNISLMIALGKTVIAFGGIYLVGRWLLRPIFREIAAAESLELFTLSVLLITLGAAWLTHQLELSLAFGAFVAGMMLGETEFRHQIEGTIRPFRDILLGLFFITIGALFDVSHISQTWPWILMLFAALTLFKVLLISLLAFFTHRNVTSAARTGIILAQGGEFGFALLSVAMREQLLPPDYGQVVLGALLFSMLLAPLLIRYNATLADFIVPKRFRSKVPLSGDMTAELVKDLRDHVVICGFRRVGQSVAKILDDEDIPYVGIELDPQLVYNCHAVGCPVIYGDAALYEILATVKIAKAKALVITFDSTSVSSKVIQQVRSHHKNLPIFVRTADDSVLESLQECGATEVIPSTLETSLTLASHLLLAVDVPADRITKVMNKIRKTRYRLLREVIPGEG